MPQLLSLLPLRRSPGPVVLLALVYLCSFAWVGCDSDHPVLPFVIVTPEGEDTFAGVTEVRAVFGGKEKRTSLSDSESPFELKLELPTGETSSVLLQGLDSTGQVLCRGRSPQILSVGASQTLTLYVGRVGAFGLAPGKALASAQGMAAADYRVENWDGVDNDTSATVFFGGIAEDSATATSVFYYDTYFHETLDLPALPAPRSGLTAMNIDSGYFLLLGGWDEEGNLTGQLDLFRPGSVQFEYATDLDYGFSDTERAEAPVGMLGPYPSLLQGLHYRVMNSFLVVGGLGPSGPRCDALHLVAGFDVSTYLWSVEAEQRSLAACRHGHSVTITRVGSGTTAQLVALVYGGAESPSDPVAETLRLTPTQVDVDTLEWNWAGEPLLETTGPMVRDHAALALADGKILVLGGETGDGTVLADGWLYDATDDSFTTLPGLLETARFGHSVTRLGQELVVAGGTGPGGAPLATAEVFDLSGGTPARLRTISLAIARTHHHAFLMPTGTIGILGGVDGEGRALDLVEIYTPELSE